ncbi:MAG: hypothetical protein ACRET8_00685 [Burkholderiales bacterium]
MRRLVLLVAVLFVVAPASAAPKATHPEDCRQFMNLALYSAALIKNKVPRRTIEASLREVFIFLNDDAVLIGKLIFDQAYREIARGTRPAVFASRLGTACMRNDGDMDSVLGEGI